MKRFLRLIIPRPLLLAYHRTLAVSGALLYGFPSRQMVVIGITGTKGKSTTTYLTAKLFEHAGFRVGATGTFFFKVADREWANDTKQTMQGRSRLQRLLRQMAAAGCEYACIETSSEGIAQFRHVGITYDTAVFTNLSPEHLEAHGGYERYRNAKGKLFAGLMESPHKVLHGQPVPKRSVVNLDDREAKYFSHFPADEHYGFGVDARETTSGNMAMVLRPQSVHIDDDGITFTLNNVPFTIALLGRFNLYNILAAITIGRSHGLSMETMRDALAEIRGIPGRLERIENNIGIRIFVDYAHEPAGLEEVLKTVKPLTKGKLIVVLGSQGGGRDRAKRPMLGQLGGTYADEVIVTNEDPYDEAPQAIIDDVAAGALKAGKKLGENCWAILDRREAIRQALMAAKKGDTVLITGKGAEQSMVVAHGKKIPWDDRKVVREILNPKHPSDSLQTQMRRSGQAKS